MQWPVGIVSFSVVALLGTASLSCLATTAAPPVAHTFPVRTRTLPSGMRVVVEQDDGATVVGVAVVIDVGQADDPAARPGLAHLAEHLLFALPDETGRSMWRRLIDVGAGNVNATTGPDRTTAYAFGPSSILDDLAGLFVARFEDPAQGLEEEWLAKERRVVDEELALRESADSQGERLVINALTDRLLLHDPAAVRTGLDDISLDDIRAFFGTYYRPERMTILVSGPIPPDWDRRLLEHLPADLFGSREEQRQPVRRPLARFDQARPLRPEIVSMTADVADRELWLEWHLPPAQGKDEVPFRMTADLVGGLFMAKVEAGEVSAISRASASVFSSASADAFLLRITLRRGVDPEAARKEAREVLARLSVLPIADLRKSARRRAELDLQAARLREALAMESLVSRMLRRTAIAHNRPEDGVSEVVKAAIETSLNGVCAIVSRYLAGPPARSVLLTPRPGVVANVDRTALPASIGPPERQPEVESEDRAESGEPGPHDARSVTAVAQLPGTSAAHQTKLSNGLTLIVLPRLGLPVATMLLGFHADPQAGENAAIRVAARFGRSVRLSQVPLERAILQTSSVELDGYIETLQMFSSSTTSAIDLLWEEASRWSVTWPPPAASVWLQNVALNEVSVSGRLSRSFAKALIGEHPYRLDVTSANLHGLSASDVQSWIEGVRRPANGVLVVVGDVDPAAVERDADDKLSDWSADAHVLPSPPEPPHVVGVDRTLPVLSGVDASRTWTKLEFGCILPPVRGPRDEVVGALFTDALSDDLFQRLRVDLGASYAPKVSHRYYRGGTHLLAGMVDVDPKFASRAQAVLQDWLDPAGTAALEPKAIEKARWRAARQSGLRNATNGAVARRLFDAWNMGWSPQSLDAYPKDLASVTTAEVTGVLAACRRSAVLSILGPQ